MRYSVASVAATRALEAEVIDAWEMPALLWMEKAATGVVRLLSTLGDPLEPVVVLAGPGHNGADGVAAARLLAAAGCPVEVMLLEGTPSAMLERQCAWARHYGVGITTFDPLSRPGGRVVDAMFGFGLNRPLEGSAAAAIDWLEWHRPSTVVAIDLPSGLDGDRGVALGPCVRATHTVAAGLIKTGVLCDPALEWVGELTLAEIGFPLERTCRLPGSVLLQAPPLPRRARGAHKGEAGYCLILGGSQAMTGAPVLACRAAGRAGAGVVVAAVPAAARDVVAAGVPEAVVVPLSEAGDELAPDAWEGLVPWVDKCRAGLIGPGLGASAGALAVCRRLWETWPHPLVVDADALRLEAIAEPPAGLRVLTPHPGEAGRLLGCSAAEVQADRVGSALRLAARHGAWVVLKGARPILAGPDGRYRFVATGTPALATGGSGDVLGGMLVGLLAQGLEVGLALETGLVLHGLAGQLAAAPSERSVVAGDLVEALPRAFAALGGEISSGELVRIGG